MFSNRDPDRNEHEPRLERDYFMPYDRNRLQRPLWGPESGADAIMTPFSPGETRRDDDLTVTARGSAFIALPVLPIIVITGVRDPAVLGALAMAISVLAAGTHLVYKRVRRF
ncbi:hypothetical protein [Streptomyces sp. NPDC000229]|uniref:hypothetical protein n=1 Tax=Streptomyces sp. NPDC000229 TaxID=3154247 RepID=UPI0033200E8E